MNLEISNYLLSFLIGGILCAVAQVLLDRTKITMARILVLYVVTGVILTAVGIYDKIVEIGGAGAKIPLTGFGYALAKGVTTAINEKGFIGIFTGGLSATSSGIAIAIFLGFLICLIAKSKPVK